MKVRGKVKINLGSKIEKKVDIFLILCLRPLQVAKTNFLSPIASPDVIVGCRDGDKRAQRRRD